MKRQVAIFFSGLMNQMNPMNLFIGAWGEKNIFYRMGVVFAGIRFIHVHPHLLMEAFGLFFPISFILLHYSMYQMYMDEPLGSFKRFLVFGIFADEPSQFGKVHQGSFGSLRRRLYE